MTTATRQEFTSHDAWHIATSAAYPPEALHRSTAADGKTELFNLPGYPLMVRAVDFNRLHTESEMRRTALLDEMQKAALAAGQTTAAQPVVPAEWPTNEMIDAGRKAAASQGRLLGSGQSLWHVFRAMLAAAPAQPVAQQGVAYAELPDEREMLKHALWLASSFTVHRYMMSNAEGRWSGAEKATCHDELCCLYVAVFRGAEVDRVRVDFEADWVAVHDATQELTDHMDVVIGFPLKGVPDYEALAPKFFAYFHRLATHALRASHGQAPAGAAHAADSAPAVGYPPLPNLDGSDEQIWEAISNWKTATPGADAVRKANKVENAIIGTMRACVDADRAARAPADSVQEDAARESEYRRGYRHGYEQRDAEVRGAMA